MTPRPAQPTDAAAIAEVHIRSWRATYAGLLGQSFLDSLDHAAFTAQWQGWLALDAPYTTLLAEGPRAEISPGKGSHAGARGSRGTQAVDIQAGDPLPALLGFAAGGTIREPLPPFDAELYALYVLPDAQRKGLGRQLFAALARRLAASGSQHLMLWSLRDNPSTAFYGRVGGEFITESTTTLGTEQLPTVAFGWREIAARSWS